MNIIEEAIRNILIDTGIITYVVPTILFFAIMYVFLNKSKIVESKVLASLIAFFSSLLVLVFPLASGINLALYLSVFFSHLFILSLIFLVGLIIASIFYPNFSDILARFKSRSMIGIMIIIALVAFVTSGLISAWISSIGGPKYGATIGEVQPSSPVPSDIAFTFGSLILLIIFAVILVAISRISSRGL
ncbi:MAG: hypothetical protein QW197_02480 [Candidatus Aenigmatarchaeota archaeon]